MNADPPTAQYRVSPSPWALVLAAAAVVVGLWFVANTITAILLVFFAIVVAIALAGPVHWLEGRGGSKRWARPLVLVGFFVCVALVGWLVIPELAAQIVVLVNSLPDLIRRIDGQIAGL